MNENNLKFMNFREFYELGLGLEEAPHEKELSNSKGGLVAFCEFSHIMTYSEVIGILKDNKNIFYYTKRHSYALSFAEVLNAEKMMQKERYKVYFFFIEKVKNLYFCIKFKNFSHPLDYKDESILLKDGFFGCFITDQEKSFEVKAYGFCEKDKISGAEIDILFKEIN